MIKTALNSAALFAAPLPLAHVGVFAVTAIIGGLPQAQAHAPRVEEMRREGSVVAQAISTSEMERLIFEQINQYRARKGLRALVWNADIAAQARSHSQNMAKKAVPFGHRGFDQRSKNLKQTLQPRSVAENVAWVMSRRNPMGQAIEAWINSQKHRDNIEGNFNLTGIGISISASGEYYFTEVFAQK